MAFPQVKLYNSGTDGSAVTTHNITLPTGIIREGDIILIAASSNADGFDWSDANADGWMGNATLSGTTYGVGVWFKISDGTESGNTVQFSTTSANWSWASMVIGDPDHIKRTKIVSWMRDAYSGTTTSGFWPLLNSSIARDVYCLNFLSVGPGITLSSPFSGWASYNNVNGSAAALIIQDKDHTAAAFDVISQGSSTLSGSSDGWGHSIGFVFHDTFENYEHVQDVNYPERWTTDQFWYSQWNMDDTDSGVAQSFKANGGKITRVVAPFFKDNAAQTAGTITAKIYAHSGTFAVFGSSVPTGSALATSNSVNISDIIVAYSGYSHAAGVEFVFSTPYQTTAGTVYCVAFEVSGNGTTYPVYAVLGAVTNDIGNMSSYNGSWTAQSEEMQIQIHIESFGRAKCRKNIII